MRWIIPHRPLWLRWALILVGAGVFFWSGLEDDRLWLVVMLGVLSCGIALAHWLTGAVGGRVLRGRMIWAAWASFGGLTGGGGIFASVLLLAFKDARHAHPFPDSPPDLLAALLVRMPVWGLSGALIGVGIYLVWRAHTPRLG